VVIGGLFTSTVRTLVRGAGLDWRASWFAGRRSTREPDDLLRAAEDRRFKPLGLREGGPAAAPMATRYVFSLTLEPEAGRLGDREVLEALVRHGLTVEPVPGTTKVRVGVVEVEAASAVEASLKAIDQVRQIVPDPGYRISAPEPVSEDGQAAPREARRPVAVAEAAD